MKKLNWGIIGLGAVAQKFSEAFAQTTNSTLLAIASNNSKKLESFKKQFFIEDKFSFKNYEDLINCKEVDIVYIALPNSLHFHWIKECIKSNKNTLVEKPVTLNYEEAKSVKKILNNKNIFFGEAFMYRYHPQINYILKLIKNGTIGSLLSMASSFGENILTKKKFIFFEKKKKIKENDRRFEKKLGGGCILDLGCYPTSFSLLINSTINKYDICDFNLSNTSRIVGETGVDIHSSAELLFKSGFKSKVEASFQKNIGSKSIITGNLGEIVVNNTWKGDDSVIIKKKGNSEIKNFNNNRSVYSYQIEKISKNILSGKNKVDYPGMNFDETLLNMKIIDEWVNV
tara:strand:+ start:187 stop:1215 length:1029 start_codon:yes stop_codon:yes gene_type:complete